MEKPGNVIIYLDTEYPGVEKYTPVTSWNCEVYRGVFREQKMTLVSGDEKQVDEILF